MNMSRKQSSFASRYNNYITHLPPPVTTATFPARASGRKGDVVGGGEDDNIILASSIMIAVVGR